MKPLSEAQILHFLLQIGVMLLLARALGDLMKRIGQASVIGELVAGVLLGPSILGAISPVAYAFVFPSDPVSAHLLESVSWLGVILLLLCIGLETDLEILRGMGRTAGVISACGVVIPFLCGLALGYLLPAKYLVNPDHRLIFTLFMAVAIAISAVPVIAKILIDLGLMHRDLGLLILAAGIIDDTTGWLLLSLIAGLAQSGKVDLMRVGIVVFDAALFIAFCYFAGWRIIGRIFRWVDDRTYVEHGKFTTMIVIAIACAIITQAIGIHAVFGAFIAGVMLNVTPRVRKREREEVEAVALGFMAPIFFAYSGLKVDLSTLREPQIALMILAIACAAKFIGAGLGGLAGRLKWREALAVAIGMNARGGMEILVALIGLSLGVLTPQIYTVIIFVAVVTSVMTPPLLSWAIKETGTRPSEAEREGREKLLARLPISHEGAKLLVLTGGGPHADLAAHLAAGIGNHEDASITIFRAITKGESAKSEEFNAQFARLKALAEQAGAKNVHQRTGSGDSIHEAITAETERGYDAIFAGASHLSGHDDLGGEILRNLVANAHAPVVIVRSANTAVPFTRLLTPVTGAAFARLGATVAIQYARAFGSRVTALYVRENPHRISIPMLGANVAVDGNEGSEFVDEISRLGRELGVTVEAQLGTGRNPENVILSTAMQDGYDLLVMGVLFRSSDERLFFGPKVREIIGKARCAVAVVVPPQRSDFRA